ncbi:hypothetical protein [Scytonema sp. UIC 10036]|uniref:hypothetical protein n=1 Tax=Scytonema sp. UIC 10036 TaxID=2304196 RepID=UPI001FA95796|nr:hypothetical protein [Scytonema sp. UIC 10036]
MLRSDSYQDYLIESLRDPKEAVAYIEAILEAENPEPELLRLAIEDVIDEKFAIEMYSRQLRDRTQFGLSL